MNKGGIMNKGLVCGLQKFSVEDGPGIRTTVFLKGCPLRCSWCHNPEMLNKEQELYYSPNRCIHCLRCVEACPVGALESNDGQIIINREKCIVCGKCVESCYAKALTFVADKMTVEEIIEKVERDKTFYERSGGGMTLSGGEVLFSADFSIEIAKKAKTKNISVAIETSGFGDYKDLFELSKFSDYILFDIKSMDPKLHKQLTGIGNGGILKNLQKLCEVEETRKKITIRMPMISGVNDSIDMVIKAAKFIKSLGLNRIDFLPYHELGVSKATNTGRNQNTFETPKDEHLIKLARAVRDFGIEVNIMGVEEQ